MGWMPKEAAPDPKGASLFPLLWLLGNPPFCKKAFNWRRASEHSSLGEELRNTPLPEGANEQLSLPGSAKGERGLKTPMATSGEKTALGELSQEATCPLCLDFFKQPMGLSCGHNFCDCLAQLGPEASCPSAEPRWSPAPAPTGPGQRGLPGEEASAVGGSPGGEQRPTAVPGTQAAPAELLLQREEPPLPRLPGGAPRPPHPRSFRGCPTIQVLQGGPCGPLCVGALPFGTQEWHPLFRVQDLLDDLLKSLRKEEQKLLHQREAEEESRQQCQELLAAEKQKVGLALESLQELLQEKQPVWLGWLAKQEEEMEAEWRVARPALQSGLPPAAADSPDGEEVPPAGRGILAGGGALAGLKGSRGSDIQDTVDRCRSYVVRESVSPRLQGRLRTLLGKNASVRQIVDSYKASLQAILTTENLERLLTTAPAPEQPRSPKVQSQGGAQQRLPQPGPGQLIHLVKRLSEGAQEESSGQRLCQEHRQPLQSFCSREKSLLCPGCLEGHQGHPLLSLPEAAQQYKDLLDDLMKSLRKEEQKVLHQRQAEEESRQQCQELLAGEKQEVGLVLESCRSCSGEAADLAGLAGRAGGEDGGRVWGGPGPALQLGLLPAAADGPDGEEVPPGRQGILAGDIQDTIDR
ncbi:hypothetical protein E2320_014283 [Naja naja]|nr:hypothetical protein E2320_014283 [Naja naja]